MKSNSLFHLVSPIGAFLASFRADTKTEAYVVAVGKLAALGRQRGRVRLADNARDENWESTIALSKTERDEFAAIRLGQKAATPRRVRAPFVTFEDGIGYREVWPSNDPE
jgi:hypothetical protein